MSNIFRISDNTGISENAAAEFWHNFAVQYHKVNEGILPHMAQGTFYQ